MEKRSGEDRRKHHTFVTIERRKGPWDRRKISREAGGAAGKQANDAIVGIIPNMYRYKDNLNPLPFYFDPRMWFFIMLLLIIIGLVLFHNHT